MLRVRGFDLWPPHAVARVSHFQPQPETERTPASCDPWLCSYCPSAGLAEARQSRWDPRCRVRGDAGQLQQADGQQTDAVRHCFFISMFRCPCLTLAGGRFLACVCVLRLKARSSTRTWRPTWQRWKVSVDVHTPSKHGRQRHHVWSPSAAGRIHTW